MLSDAIDDARGRLQRAARAGDLDEGRDLARRARNALDDAETAAMACRCEAAASEFSTASSRARRARDADDPNEFVDALNSSIRSFNEGLAEVRQCAGRR